MRILNVIAFAAAATLSVSAFADPSGSIPSSQAASTVTVQAATHSQFKLSAADAHGMAGTFRLDDGREMVLTSVRDKLFAEFDGKREELLPVAQNHFVSRDTGARLTFDRVPYGLEVTLNQAKN